MLDYIRKNTEVMSDEWALATIPFCELDKNIIEELNIKQILLKNGIDLSTEEIMDEDNEIGLHTYWDKKNHPDSVEIGLYAFGGGDCELDKTLRDILTCDEYEEIFRYGYEQIMQQEETNYEEDYVME